MMKFTSLRFPRAAISFAFAAAFIPAVASAGLFDDEEARKAIVDLRTKVDTTSAQLEAKINGKLDGKADKSSALELSGQLDTLRGEIAKLRGQLEVLANDLANTQRRQQDLYVDLDNRLRKLEPQKVMVDGKEATLASSEQRAYEAALSLFKTGSYKEAGAAFYAFNLNHPQSALAGTAQYWLGNSYYAQRDCKSAIGELQKLVSVYPDHPKSPDALLIVSGCQVELKEKAASRKTLEQLISQYPGSDEAKSAKKLMSAK
jgi:tol-pal system protein YbgF